MRLLILALLASQCFGAFSYRRSITVNASQVSSGPHTDFPMLIAGTYSYLAVTGSGGNVQDAQGDDIQFFSNSDCATGKLPWQRESYNSTTGAIVFWVKVSSIDTASVIYMCYGDATETSDESNPTGVWNSAYLRVWHMGDGSTPAATDSTSNAGDGTLVNTPTATAGKVHGAVSFANASDEYATVSNTINPTAITIEAWINATSFPNAYNGIFTRGNNTSGNGAKLFVKSTGALAGYFNATTSRSVDPASTTLSTSTWYHVAATYDSSVGLVIYVNGASDGTQTADGSLVTTAIEARIADDSDPVPTRTFNGAIDEMRISNVVRSAGWLLTSYRTANDPASFYAVGSEEAVSATRRRLVIIQ